MPLIADPNDVMADLGYDTRMTNIVAASRSALRMATASLASALQTDFSQSVVVDTYFVERPSDSRRHGDFSTEFWLSQGFVNAQPLFAGAYADSAASLTDASSVSNVSAAMLVDLERGVAVDTLNQYHRSWVRLVYTKGFPLSASDPTLFDLAVVPDWLQECGTIMAKIALQSNPALEDPQIKMDSKLLQAQVASILRPHLRYAPAATKPILAILSGTPELPTATAAAQPPTDQGVVAVL